MLAQYLLGALASLPAMLAAPAEIKCDTTLANVQFTNSFPTKFQYHHSISLTWTGGDGWYNVQSEVTENTSSSQVYTIRTNTSETQFEYALDSSYPDNTTITFTVSDANDVDVDQSTDVEGPISIGA